MTINFTRTFAAALFGFAAFGAVSSASAGILPDGNGGAVCKGAGSCIVLEIDCKGTYTDGTQKDGTVYGKCSKTAQVKPGFKLKTGDTNKKKLRR